MKPKKEGEPAWPSPWSEGRPGWHIECSEMSKKYLGEHIDIHAGGEDLIFPHHENEIAQSEAANGKEFAKYWIHNGFLNIDNKKMSKSEGNFFTVKEIGAKFPLEVLRFFMLSVHYRNPINFSRELMEATQTSLERIKTAVFNLNDLLKSVEDKEMSAGETKELENVAALQAKFEAAMDDDFNTADAISVIFELVKLANSTVSGQNSKAFVQKVVDEITKLCDILVIVTEQEVELLDDEIEQLIEERQAARKAKNFARADEVRNLLLEKGIILEDTREGVRWKRA